jgi:hypothetical protein
MFLMPVPSSAADAVATYRSNADSATNATVFTFSSIALGTGGKKIVGVGGGDVGDVAISGVTIDGNAMTSAGAATVNSQNRMQFFYYDGATAATGDVVVTWASSNGSCTVTVWDATGAAAGGPSDVGTSTASPLSDEITCQPGGFILGVGYVSGAGGETFAWTNLTEKVDEAVGGDGNTTSASDNFAALQTEITITATQSGGGSPCMSLAAWDKG